MFSGWFNRKKQINEDEQNSAGEKKDFTFLGADMHSHFLPAIDDGSPTLEISIELIRKMVELGFNTIVTTPHIMIDFYPNNKETIKNALQLVQNELIQKNIKVSLSAAAEYFVDEYFIKLIDKEELLTITKKEVLIEFSMYSEPPMLKEVLFKLVSNGYVPVIAHPERYQFLNGDIEKYVEMKDRGCLLQLNTLSLLGYYGQNIKKIADEILDKKLYDYCGTDMHNEKHVAAIQSIFNNKVYNSLVNYPFLNNRLCF